MMAHLLLLLTLLLGAGSLAETAIKGDEQQDN